MLNSNGVFFVDIIMTHSDTQNGHKRSADIAGVEKAKWKQSSLTLEVKPYTLKKKEQGEGMSVIRQNIFYVTIFMSLGVTFDVLEYISYCYML